MTTDFYANIQRDLSDFIEHCHDLTNVVRASPPSIPCLSSISSDTLPLAIDHLNSFIHTILSADLITEIESTIAIVRSCSHLVEQLNEWQYFFIEYALDDYLLLDEHLNTIFDKVYYSLELLRHSTIIDDDLYSLEKNLQSYLPSNYLPSTTDICSSLTDRVVHTLRTRLCQSFPSSWSSPEDDNNDDPLSASGLFSSATISIRPNDDLLINSEYSSHSLSASLLQLDKINIRTTGMTSTSIPSFQFDTSDLEQIDMCSDDDKFWTQIEHRLSSTLVSIWSNEVIMESIDPWCSETLWTFVMHFKWAETNFKHLLISITHWCICLLTIEALNRDWHLFYAKTLIDTIVTNRWRTIRCAKDVHVSSVGHGLNQMFLRLVRIALILKQMKLLVDRSSHLANLISTKIDPNMHSLVKRTQMTFSLLILWLDQHADTFINGNLLERTLLICKSDLAQLSESIEGLLDAFRQLNIPEKSIETIQQWHSSCQSIAVQTMLKFYRRVHLNTSTHFRSALPWTPTEWRTANRETSYIMLACDKLLKPLFSHTECLNIDSKLDVYERTLSCFVQAWTTVLLERKIRFSDEMIDYLQRDFEDLQLFLSRNICDQELVSFLIKSSAVQQIADIIDLLKSDESNLSVSHLPNHDRWIRSKKSSSFLIICIQNTFCCQKRNRVTTGSS